MLSRLIWRFRSEFAPRNPGKNNPADKRTCRPGCRQGWPAHPLQYQIQGGDAGAGFSFCSASAAPFSCWATSPAAFSFCAASAAAFSFCATSAAAFSFSAAPAAPPAASAATGRKYLGSVSSRVLSDHVVELTPLALCSDVLVQVQGNLILLKLKLKLSERLADQMRQSQGIACRLELS